MRTTTKSIERSTGATPPVPWAGPLPGGGYNGKTKRLDRAVQRHAEWLLRTFGLKVEIRFNSDQLSGGAFIYPLGDHGKWGAPEIGLSAGLITPPHVRARRRREFNRSLFHPLEWEDCWTEQVPLYFQVLIHKPLLADTSDFAKHAMGPDSPFAVWRVRTPAEARRLVLKRVCLDLLPKRNVRLQGNV